MASPFYTAATKDGSLVAVLDTSTCIGHSRISIPLYDTEGGSLQSTLTASLPPSEDEEVAVQKLVLVGSDYVCVLFRTGSILVWNVTRGVLVHTLKLQDGALAVDMTSSTTNEDSLYVLTSKKTKLYVHEYSLQTGKVVSKMKTGMHMDNKSSSNLAVSTNYVAIRSPEHKIRVLSLENGTKVAKLKLPNSNVTLLAMEESHLAVVTSTGIVLYNVESPETIVGQVFVSQPIHSLELVNNTLVVTTEASTTLLYKIPTSITKEPLEPITTFTCRDGVETARVFASSTRKHEQLVAVVHSVSKGVYIQSVSCGNDNDNKSMLEKVEIGYPVEKDDESTSTPSKSTERSKPLSTTTTTLGPGQAGGEALQASDYHSTKKQKLNDDEEEEEEDVSIAQRLEQLANEMQQEDDDDQEQQSTSTLSKTKFNTKKATTESLSNLLKQALHSGDDAMLELSLGVRDKRVIFTSLQALDSTLLSLLLTKLTVRISQKPNRAGDLSMWISLILQSGKLQGEQMQHQLRPLRNLIRERVESFPHLVQLEGRLSILAAMK